MPRKLVLICLCLALGAASASCADSYVLHNLGCLGGSAAEASDINNARQIVGRTDLSSGDTTAFLWQNGVTQILRPGEGYVISHALRINESGHVLGLRFDYQGHAQPFLYDGTMHDPGILGDVACYPGGINGNGDIVVNPESAAYVDSSTVRWHDGQTTPIQPLVAGQSIRGYDINESGLVVGAAESGAKNNWGYNETHAYIWRDGVTQDINPFGKSGSYARAVNGSGQVVGGWNTEDYTTNNIFIWEDGVATNLGNMGGYNIWANDINESGEFVGGAEDFGSRTTPYVYKDGSFVLLPDLGNGGEAIGINDDGWIAGYVIAPGGSRYAAYWAVPEPTPLFALICGIAGLGVVVRLRKR